MYSSTKHLEIVNTRSTQRNKHHCQKSIRQALTMVDQELDSFEFAGEADSVRQIVANLLSNIELKRQKELSKAFAMMGELDERQRKIINDLTGHLLQKTFHPVIENLQREAAKNELELVGVATKLFQCKQ